MANIKPPRGIHPSNWTVMDFVSVYYNI